MTPARHRQSYEEACRLFRWHLPECANIAVDVVDRQAGAAADGHRTALISESAGGVVARYTFLDLMRYSHRLAQVLAEAGIGPGQRVALVMEPSGAAAVAMLGVLKTGAAAVPLPAGEKRLDLLESLSLSAVIGEEQSLELVERARRKIDLTLAMAAHCTATAVTEMWTSMIGADERFEPAILPATQPAIIQVRADGTTLPLSHRALRARVAGAEYGYQTFPHVGDVMWSAGDWASDSGWADAVFPAWFHAVQVVTTPARRGDLPGLLSRWGVRNVHLPIGRVDILQSAIGRSKMPLRSLVVTGQPSPELAGWMLQRFAGAYVPTFGSQALGPLIAPSPALGFKTSQGSLGRPAPGYGIDIVDGKGRVLAAGNVGDIALLADSPLAPVDTRGDPIGERAGRWLLLGARGKKDLEGAFWPDPPLAPPVMPDPPPPMRLEGPDPKERWR